MKSDVGTGLTYREFTSHDSRVHLLEVDLREHSMRPVLAADAFPFKMLTPVFKAVEEGALAATGCGFNMTLWALQGVSDQPLHAFVIDREIWTTGIGGGGYGFLMADGRAWCQQNRIQVHVWRPDGSVIDVEHVNRGHNGKVVAFTSRGGKNEFPMGGKHYATLGNPGAWIDDIDAMGRTMTVTSVSMFDPVTQVVEPNTVVLEARWPMKLNEGDQVSWVQRLGGHHVRHVVAGATGIVQEGQNRVPWLDLDPVSSHGPDPWYVRRGPRMALGVSKNGRTAYIAVVEGRIPGSKGMRLKELATMLLSRGAWDAVNMDGGGSAFLWTKHGGLVSDSCYGDGTLEGLRPDHCSVSVF